MSAPVEDLEDAADLLDPAALGDHWRLVRLSIDHAAIANQLLAGMKPNSRRRTEVDGKSFTVPEVIAMAQVHATISAAMARLEGALNLSGAGEADRERS